MGAVRRKAVSVSQDAVVKASLLQPDKTLPLVIQPAVKGVDLIIWAKNNRELIESQLVQHGALLFRNFNLTTVPEFEQFVEAVSGELLEYRYRASPRSQVSDRVYTSTDYPADQSIFPHNEHAYSPAFPLKIYFFCMTPAQQGGETPIGDTRRVLDRIDPQIRERFIHKKVLYVRNYGDGFGLPWQTVFQTTDKTVVEEYCRAHGIEFEWKDGDRLRTRQVGPIFVRHPRTGEMIWFNHATFFHVSTLEPAVRDALLAEFNEENLPNNTYYGDGSPIEPALLEQLRAAYLQEMVAFPWEQGDILLLDNMLVVHARRPFVGPRKVVVGMAEPISSRDV